MLRAKVLWRSKILSRKNAMTVTLKLKPEIETRVIALAARQGISVEKYLSRESIYREREDSQL